ncbi:MAG: iron-sulfur cluster assembly accessory protein [Rickettsiales bacterium]|jgi:iron-sulfur cluster insertion protein|nr:iron-sulfur cluster assembly accessory protein [Rickettsiales bacterium]
METNKMSEICSITITKAATERIKYLMANSNNSNVFLRISVTSGGCNGFQSHFDFDNNLLDDDITLARDSKIFLAIDETSHGLVKGGEIEFIDELGGSYFKLTNPNASSNCGCGSSFAL